MRRWILPIVASLFFVISCAKPGIAPGDAQKGYIVWGFLGHGTTTAATNQQVTLYNQQGQAIQMVASDSMGKYVLAYHQPGSYVIHAGNHKLPVQIGRADQRKDIDLSHATGEMNYAAGAAKNMGPPSCGNAAPAQPAAQPGAPAGGPMGAPAQPAEERDPNLVGSWGRTDTLSSGDSSLSTKLSLLICADGSFVNSTGDSVGGGAGWSAENRGTDSSRGRWRTQQSIIYVNNGSGWQAYARYYVEASKLMLTFSGGNREIWYR